MRKDELIALGDRAWDASQPGIERKHVPFPVHDSRWVPIDVRGEPAWVLRSSYPGQWPHLGSGTVPAPIPGLRFELWLFQKRSSALVAAVCGGHASLDVIREAMAPVLRELVESGKYGARYRPMEGNADAEPIVADDPGAVGIVRAVPLEPTRLSAALETLVRDSYWPLQRGLAAIPDSASVSARFEAEAAVRDPRAELLARFKRPG